MIMKYKLMMLIGCLTLLILYTQPVQASDAENKSLQVIVNNDSIIISIENDQGQGKSISLATPAFADTATSGGLMIKNELYIDNDKIIIDGEEFTSADIQKMMISRYDGRNVTFRAGLPGETCAALGTRRVIKIDRSDSKDKLGFSGLVIAKNEEIRGDAVAITGDIKVFGKVDGDIISVLGNIFMYDGSYAGGDVASPFGKVITEGDYRIKGTLSSLDKKPNPCKTNVDVSARFNRVEGFTPMMDIRFRDFEHQLPDVDFGLSYGFAIKNWNVDFGFKQNIGIGGPFYLGGKYYSGVYTPDQWYFTQTENTIAGLFFKEDYYDFYRRKGGQVFLGREFWEKGFAQAEFTAQANSPLKKYAISGIFGGHKKFRDNYSTILPDSSAILGLKGDLRMIGLHFGWDSRDKKYSYHHGQYLSLSLQTTGKSLIGKLGGDFSYDILEAEIQHYQPITNRQFLGVRLRGGLSNQQIPLDRWFSLGGMGTLRGYDFKEFVGNRYFLTNIDYYWEFSEDFAMAVFADLGQTGFGKRQFERSGLKSDLGIGVIVGDAIRLDIAQRLDDTGRSPILTVRCEETF
jgi:hypothetical protein